MEKKQKQTLKWSLRLLTLLAALGFLFFRRQMLRPSELHLKSAAEIAALPTSMDSHPCFLAERNPSAGTGALRAEVRDCEVSAGISKFMEEAEVDLSTGRFMLRQTDFLISDSMPLVVTRGYSSWDLTSRAFGIGSNHSYDMFPWGSRFPYTYMNVLLGDGTNVYFARISQGTGYADAVFEHKGSVDSFFQGARIRWNRDHWDFNAQDGTLFQFPEAYYSKRGAEGALVRMRDSQGHEIRMARDQSRNLTSLTSPGGHWIRFTYDAGNRIDSATDDAGETKRYEYDIQGRLSALKSHGTLLWRYEYSGGRMSRVQDGKGTTLIAIEYLNGRTSKVETNDGQVYGFEYLFDRDGRVAETVVTKPGGEVVTKRFEKQVR
jgi:YD repeat-containing protein